ncbi:SDR family NAD(P)-dependent oxidoreductase [Sphingomonas sp. Root241]|uniref:SDR family NAD(P)-dependent oxidoreductase n=1 Tax=Sphingomonas sp. Root241 TaxID=1736501 RepID=UPI0006F93176|nr:glucose 1-dehydrogenase [Sphingomonas sp. Root241]KRC78876.1 oxidoreductase [Sphingomonas sp. Root241]
MKFKDKVALVTGGGRDIGRAVSLRLAAEGAKVAINYCNDRASAEATAREIEAAGGTAAVFQADVSKADQVATLVAGVQAKFGDRIHVLVNLAGGMVARRKLEEMDEAFYDQVMDLNLKSVFLVTRAVKPLMGGGGAIVNVSSLAGRDGGGPGASLYATSKGALMTLTRAWAKEFGPEGIRVNAVCPGLIGTSFHDIFSKPEGRAAVAANTPLRREGHPDEVADAIAYLASDEARFLTGVNLDVNGGLGFS